MMIPETSQVSMGVANSRLILDFDLLVLESYTEKSLRAVKQVLLG